MKEEETRPQIGNCKFCGQTKIIDLTEDEWLEAIIETNMVAQDIADEIAMEQCTCREGAGWRHNKKVIEMTRDHIELMFRDQYPEIADILQEAKTLVWSGPIKKLAVCTNDSGTAIMYRSNEKLEIKFTQKKETKMTSS